MTDARPWREMASLGFTAVLALAIALAAGAVGVPIAVLAIGALTAGVVISHIIATSRIAVPRPEVT